MSLQPKPLSIEMIDGKPFVSVDDLISLTEGSISEKGTQFDYALFHLATQLKAIRMRALQPTQGDET